MTRRALLLFIAMSVIWGIPYLFIRIAVSDLSPVVLVFARTAIGAMIVLPIALARGNCAGSPGTGCRCLLLPRSKSEFPG